MTIKKFFDFSLNNREEKKNYIFKRLTFIWLSKLMFRNFIFLFLFIFVFLSNLKSNTLSIPVGDSPFAMAISKSNNRFAYITKLFPDEQDKNNLIIVDLKKNSIIKRFHIGTRLVSIDLVDNLALIINEDNDYLFIVNLNTLETNKIKVGNRPSNVIAINSDIAIVTNGSSGSINFVNLKEFKVIGNEILVGKDPRDIAIHPDKKWAYVALGGENAIGVIDLQKKILTKKIKVGENPVNVKITKNGRYLISANLTKNTISILDLKDPSNPEIKKFSNDTFQLPVGYQPTKITISPDDTEAYIANLGSKWITVVDINNFKVKGIIPTSAPCSDVKLSNDGNKLFLLEFRNNANLVILNREDIKLSKMPSINLPGEPKFSIFLNVDKTKDCPGFYIVKTEIPDGAKDGYYGMEILLTGGNRLFEGGFHLGSSFGDNGNYPGYVAFNIVNPFNVKQKLKINIKAFSFQKNSSSIDIEAKLLNSKREILEDKFGNSNVVIEKNVEPDFYIIEVKSLKNEPEGYFQIDATTQYLNSKGGGFQGGVVIGGKLFSNIFGYSAFCISEAQNIKITTQGKMYFGENGAEAVAISILDRNYNLIRKVNNYIKSDLSISYPSNPSMENIVPTIYVDDDAKENGDGTKEKPFKSITEAIQHAKSNDIIYVNPGIYSPSLTGEKIPIGSAGEGKSPIPENVWIIGAGAKNTVIDAENQCGENCHAVVLPSDGIRFSGFTVKRAKDTGLYIYNASKVIIDHNLFISNGRQGVSSQNSSGLIISNNVFMANREHGCIISGSYKGEPLIKLNGFPEKFGAIFINNVSKDNRVDGVIASQGGDVYIQNNEIYFNGGMGIELNNRCDNSNCYNLNGVIKNNILIGNGGVQFAFAGAGILVTEGATAKDISGNILQNNRPFGIAIFLNGSADKISNNKIENSQSSSIAVQKFSEVKTIDNNSIYGSGLCGIFVENNSSVNEILNNDITETGLCEDCSDSKAGLSILKNSEVNKIINNYFSKGFTGVEVDENSKAQLIKNCKIENNSNGGIFLTDNSEISILKDSFIMRNSGQAGIMIENSKLIMDNVTIKENKGTGISAYNGSILMAKKSIIENNYGNIGLNFWGQDKVTLENCIIKYNGDIGIQASQLNTYVELYNNTIGNHNYGLNSQNNAVIVCKDKNKILNNFKKDILGNVLNCK